MSLPAAAEVDCVSGKGATIESKTTRTQANLKRRQTTDRFVLRTWFFEGITRVKLGAELLDG